jgi:hypothetical protein
MSQIQFGELVRKIEAANERMSVKNPHRLLLQQCLAAMLDLMKRVERQPIGEEVPR